jgi:hypothetical protein
MSQVAKGGNIAAGNATREQVPATVFASGDGHFGGKAGIDQRPELRAMIHGTQPWHVPTGRRPPWSN